MERFIRVLHERRGGCPTTKAELAFRFLIPIIENDPSAYDAADAALGLIRRCVPSEDSPLAAVLDWWFVVTTGESSANGGAHLLPESLDESVRLPMEATMQLGSRLPAAEWLDKRRLLDSELRGAPDWRQIVQGFEERLKSLGSDPDADPQELAREVAATQRRLNAQLDEMLQERLGDLEDLVRKLAACGPSQATRRHAAAARRRDVALGAATGIGAPDSRRDQRQRDRPPERGLPLRGGVPVGPRRQPGERPRPRCPVGVPHPECDRR